MRQREPRVILSFPATVDAMSMESYSAAHGVPGRLIPLPTAISAGCGMCWCAPIAEREAVERAARDAGLRVSGVHEMML